jgi:hypothetical protein
VVDNVLMLHNRTSRGIEHSGQRADVVDNVLMLHSRTSRGIEGAANTSSTRYEVKDFHTCQVNKLTELLSAATRAQWRLLQLDARMRARQDKSLTHTFAPSEYHENSALENTLNSHE